MSILFYDHLVDKTEVLLFIDHLPEPENHKGKLRQLVDDIIHQGLIEYILQKLHPHQHHTFLTRLEAAPYDPELLSYLKDHISPEFESELQKEAAKLISIIKKDLSTPL
ncbi:MAG: hypothetical protein AAB548_02335 [Patescibacteria group bacterium]